MGRSMHSPLRPLGPGGWLSKSMPAGRMHLPQDKTRPAIMARKAPVKRVNPERRNWSAAEAQAFWNRVKKGPKVAKLKALAVAEF